MDDLFSTRNALINNINKEKPEKGLRVAVETVIHNIYSGSSDQQLLLQQGIMALFGIERDMSHITSTSQFPTKKDVRKKHWEKQLISYTIMELSLTND